MSSRQQIESDEELARRLQNEEVQQGIPPQFRRMFHASFGPSGGNVAFGGTYNFQAPNNANRESRSANTEDGAENRRFHEERRREFANNGMEDILPSFFEGFGPMRFPMGAGFGFGRFPSGGQESNDQTNGRRGDRSRGEQGRGGQDLGHFFRHMQSIFEGAVGGQGSNIAFDFAGMIPGPFGELSYEDWIELIERNGGNVRRGATKEQIDALPTRTLERDLTSEDEDKTCPICLGDFKKDEVVRTLPCSHFFHAKDCIDPWLNTSTSCPRCRADIRGNGSSPGNNNNGGASDRSRRSRSSPRRSSSRGSNSPPRAGSRTRGFSFSRPNRGDGSRRG